MDGDSASSDYMGEEPEHRERSSTLSEVHGSTLSAALSEEIDAQRINAWFVLMDKYADMAIWCQGQRIPACSAILRARCRSFEACFMNGCQGRCPEIIMDSDDAAAMRAFIVYLHTSSTKHIEHRRRLDAEGRPSIMVEGYAQLIVELCRVAIKYGHPVLAEAASRFLVYESRPGEPEPYMIDYFRTNPADTLDALTRASSLPEGEPKTAIIEGMHRVILRCGIFGGCELAQLNDPESRPLRNKLEHLFRQHPLVAVRLLDMYRQSR